MKNVLTVCLYFMCVVLALPEGVNAAPSILWQRTYGGIYNEEGRSARQTADGGFIIAGGTYSYGAGSGDAYLVKTDSMGNPQWANTYGGTGYDSGHRTRQTPDGGYITTGRYSYGAGNVDAYLFKTDSGGNLQWQKAFGQAGADFGEWVERTSDGGYVLAGYTSPRSEPGEPYDYYVVKTDSAGNPVWERTFGGAGDDQGRSIRQTSDGGYIVTGCTNSYGSGSYDLWLLKTDVDGVLQWDRTFGWANSECGQAVQQTSDGGYIIGGYANGIGADYDAYLVKTDADGNLIWQRTFDSAGLNDEGSYVVQTTDGGYVLAGWTYKNTSDADIWLVKTDADGLPQWDLMLGGTEYDAGFSIDQTFDGGYIVGATTYSYGSGGKDMYLVRLGEPEIIPAPGALILGSIGVGFVGWLRRRRTF